MRNGKRKASAARCDLAAQQVHHSWAQRTPSSDDGSVLTGEYLTGKTVEREKARSFTQIGFVDPLQLDTLPKKKQVVALIDGLPQTLVKDPCPFIVSEDHKASVLFDPAAAE
jgi:adenine-specific DNA-methyltransferase